MKTTDSRELRFVEYSHDNFLLAFDDSLDAGKKRFLLHGDKKEVAEFAAKLERRRKGRACEIYKYIHSADKPLLRESEGENIDVVFVLIKEAPVLSKSLMECADFHCTIVAPITEHYFKNRPALVNSIPKSGVHMVFECMRAFGYKEPKTLDLPDYEENLLPGHFYNLQHMRPGHLSPPFPKIERFITNFSNAPVIFIFRDPRDIAVSFARYLASLADYHILNYHFKKMTPEQQIAAVIKGEYPFPVYINKEFSFSGNIRDLMMSYAEWVRCPLPNTLFLNYEALVGPKGGGTGEAQLDCLWRMQLALNIPGKTSDFSSKIYNKASTTFRAGKMGSFHHEFTPTLHKLFRDLPQDFMVLYGYDPKADKAVFLHNSHFIGVVPISETERSSHPLLLEEGYEGYNIVALGQRYWAFSQELGPIDLTKKDLAGLLEKYCEEKKCFSGDSTLEIKNVVARHRNSILEANIVAQARNLEMQNKAIDAMRADILACGRDVEALKLQLKLPKHGKR